MFASPLVKYPLWLCVSTATFFVLKAVKRLWFHPLAQYQGSKLWSISRIPYVYSLLRGTLIEDMLRMHEQYGDVIRVAPNELSFATEQAWKDIYMHRPGHKECKKDPVWYMAPNDMPQNIVTTTDIAVRARMRRLLATSFNEQSLRNQSPVLEMYAQKLLERLQSIYDTESKTKKTVQVNILNWVNFYTMDIIGDLSIGESFHCIDGSDYHPWVKTLYMFFKGMILAAAASHFPLTQYMLQNFIPKSIMDKQKEHTDFTNTKILQRLELKTDRPDLLTPFLKEMDRSPDKMSLGEIQSTFAIILVAGSETTATTLLGVFYELASHPEIQEKLSKTIRETFASESEITVASTSDIAYLDAVINEALRLDYAVPGGLPRIAPEGGDIYAGRFVPGGTSISIRPYILFRSPKYFHRPDEYVPERWLPEKQRPQEFAHDNHQACQPFNVGPTGCIGKPLAFAEMRLLIAKLIWRFEFSMTPDKPFSWESLHKMMVVEKRDCWLTLKMRDG